MALEALGRRGLSFDDYQRQRAALLGQPQQPFGFDHQGEMNAERSVVLHGRPS
ncbi:ABC-type proline/glycine betaine transport system [Pseudomonas synxantha]|uniref:ABC-type proline/glycine betaine transport system n=1 Tax=Pseudomonas synxantha TaxID=47883 RepID=A0AAU8TGQ7_9PSED|nr:ABC-type proline/glycine betaine transport system [Pseudomonas synxantha]